MKLISEQKGYIPYDTIHAKNWWSHDTYQIREGCTILGFIIPEGFVFDGATIPRWLSIAGLSLMFVALFLNSWGLAAPAALVNTIPFLFPRSGRYMPAALVHDYMLDNNLGSRYECDAIFKFKLKELGIQKWRAESMYFAVRLFSLIKKRSFHG